MPVTVDQHEGSTLEAGVERPQAGHGEGDSDDDFEGRPDDGQGQQGDTTGDDQRDPAGLGSTRPRRLAMPGRMKEALANHAVMKATARRGGVSPSRICGAVVAKTGATTGR